jgi:uncharacterized protein YpbB
MKSPSWLVLRMSIKAMIQKGGLEAVLYSYRNLADRYSVKEGSKYANSQEEVNDMVKNIPELEPIKDDLLVLCRNNRKRVGLQE